MQVRGSCSNCELLCAKLRKAAEGTNAKNADRAQPENIAEKVLRATAFEQNLVPDQRNANQAMSDDCDENAVFGKAEYCLQVLQHQNSDADFIVGARRSWRTKNPADDDASAGGRCALLRPLLLLIAVGLHHVRTDRLTGEHQIYAAILLAPLWAIVGGDGIIWPESFRVN